MEGQDVQAEGVRRLLHETIYNLCDNAIGYNVPGGSVRVTVSDAGENAVISVADTGIGIAPEHQSRIFERFYRVDKSHSKASGGTRPGPVHREARRGLSSRNRAAGEPARQGHHHHRDHSQEAILKYPRLGRKRGLFGQAETLLREVPPMLLTADIGNTNIVLALLDEKDRSYPSAGSLRGKRCRRRRMTTPSAGCWRARPPRKGPSSARWVPRADGGDRRRHPPGHGAGSLHRGAHHPAGWTSPLNSRRPWGWTCWPPTPPLRRSIPCRWWCSTSAPPPP